MRIRRSIGLETTSSRPHNTGAVPGAYPVWENVAADCRRYGDVDAALCFTNIWDGLCRSKAVMEYCEQKILDQ